MHLSEQPGHVGRMHPGRPADRSDIDGSQSSFLELIPQPRKPEGRDPRAPAGGRVGISSKHTLALINRSEAGRGGASARDLLGLVGEIQARVRERFGVELVPEPVFLGFVTP